MVQLRLIDGQTVEIHSAKFAGTTDIDEEDVSEYSLDNTIVLAVVATVDVPSFKRTAAGDIRRVNNLHVNAMRVVDGSLRDTLLDTLGVSAQTTFESLTPPPSTPVQAPTATSSPATTVDEEEEGEPQEPEEFTVEGNPNRIGRSALDQFLQEATV